MINFLSNNMFRLEFSCSRFLNNSFSDTIVSVNVPGFQLGIITHPTPVRAIERPGDSIIYNDLSLEFNVDENLINWYTIYKWINDLRDMEETDFDNSEVCRATLTLLTNKNNSNKSIEFDNVFPYNLSDFQMALNDGEQTGIICETTFKYSSMRFIDSV